MYKLLSEGLKLTDNVMQLFEESGAVLHGHFILTSGLHSDTYMQCAKLFENGEISQKLCAMAADKVKKYNADVVVSPAVGAIIFGYELGKQLGLPNMFAEREKDGNFALRRGFELKKGSRVIVAENVVTTGGSVKEVIDLIGKLGSTVVAVAEVVDRSGGKVDFGVPNESLLQIDVKTYQPEECPMCKQGTAAVKPGSKGLK
ncbi:MAG: orotate phosphoribosyltransferase [Clostridiales bacterium]|nr:orotate phosphoribosyltransferase [Clostridiales bacterium]